MKSNKTFFINLKGGNLVIFISLILFLLALILFVLFSKKDEIKEFFMPNDTSISSIEVLTYNQEEDYINLVIKASNEQVSCAYSENDIDTRLLSFEEMINNECNLSIPYSAVLVYFKNENGVVSKPQELNNFVVDYGVKEKYYLALNDSQEFLNNVLSVGTPTFEVSSDSDKVLLSDKSFTANENVNATVTIKNGDIQSKSFNVVFTNTIVSMPKEFNSKKPTLGCHQYTEEEAVLLDEILESRVNEVGYGTRAAAVAVARFISLEFPYKISYYYENGRISGQPDYNFVDGEGRYYHKGLYLSESKYKDLQASISGPAMWGCKITNWEDNEADGYIRGLKMPNGLDCSGFVTWDLKNAGFDPGDYGAGETPYPHQMTDLGDYTRLTRDLVYGNTIKPGDFFNFWGHITIIAGIDEENFYVVESLNTFKHLVMVKYPKNKVMNTFTHVVLMDKYYKNDGKLTNMWY